MTGDRRILLYSTDQTKATYATKGFASIREKVPTEITHVGTPPDFTKFYHTKEFQTLAFINDPSSRRIVESLDLGNYGPVLHNKVIVMKDGREGMRHHKSGKVDVYEIGLKGEVPFLDPDVLLKVFNWKPPRDSLPSVVE